MRPLASCTPALVAALWLLWLTPGAATAQVKQSRVHVVQPGDSCWSIALQVFGRGEAYRIIHRHNDLGPMPHILKPGQQIRLPGKDTGPDARVAWLKHQVLAKIPTAVDWLKARKDMGLWRLYKVSTGESSSAGIRFEDNSSLKMRQKALLVIYGGTSARTRLKRKQRGVTVVLEKGTIRGGLARMDREASGLDVRTPSARIKLQSRSAQVEVDPRKTSIVSVYDGKAQVAAGGAKVEVPDGHGTFVEQGKKPAPPRRLPPPPRWDRRARQLVVLVPAGMKGTFEARWSPVKSAARYRVELSRNARFTIPIVDAVVGAGVLRFSARDLAPGTYHARVAAMDKARLEGRPSSVMRVKVARLQTSRVLALAANGVLEAVGLLRLSPHQAMASQVEMAVDGSPFAPGTSPVRLSKPGLYVIRVRPTGGQVTTSLKVRLLGVKGELQIPSKPLEIKGASAQIRLGVQDEKGRPVWLPGLAVRAWPGGPLKLEPAGAGVMAAALPAPATYTGEPVRLVASWAAGELGRAEVKVKAPPEPPPPPPPSSAPSPPLFSWPEAPVALVGPEPGPYLPARFALPVTHLGLSAQAAGLERRGGGDDPVILRLALHGELSLLKGRLGLEAELPWFQTDMMRDETGDNNLGDLRLGARYVVLQAHGLSVAPSLRITAPTGGLPTGRQRSVLLEPSALVQWQFRQLLTLGTQQALVVEVGPHSDTGLYYTASYGAAVRLWRIFSLAAEVATIFGLSGPDRSELASVAAGGALRLHLDRIRLSVTAGGGLNEDGRRALGSYSTGLTLDLGF